MVKYPVGILPCPSRDSYSMTRMSATTRLPYVKGRATHVLKDMYPVSSVNFTLLMRHDQFVGWQDFWTNQIGAGADWFEWEGLYVGAVPETVICHATEPFSAQVAHDRTWDVGLSLECYV